VRKPKTRGGTPLLPAGEDAGATMLPPANEFLGRVKLRPINPMTESFLHHNFIDKQARF
jgi:hypothetical protein